MRKTPTEQARLLKDLPVGIVEIDERFVKNLAQSATDQAMVKGMYRVDYGQGDHLGRPELRYTQRNVEDSAAHDSYKIESLG